MLFPGAACVRCQRGDQHAGHLPSPGQPQRHPAGGQEAVRGQARHLLQLQLLYPGICCKGTPHGSRKDVYIISIMPPISSPNHMFDSLLELSHRDDSNKWSDIGFGEEITQVE